MTDKNLELTKAQTLEVLEGIKISAYTCLEPLRDILKTIEPSIMKSTKVNMALEREEAKIYREHTQSEITYFESLIEQIDKKIGELNDNPKPSS